MVSAVSTVGLAGFTKLSKGLSGVLVIGYIVSLLFPWTISYVALVPGKAIVPFVWNVITAGYFEQSLFGLILSVFGLLLSGKLLEPIWTSREFMKFINFVNIFTLLGVCLTAITSYFITRREAFLYTPLSGFHGVLSGFLVAVKQTMPDLEVKVLGRFSLGAKWLPSLLVFVAIILSFLTSEAMRFLPFVVFGTYGSWIYLRYIQRNLDTNLRGDADDEFAFCTFFPKFLRPSIDFLASILHKLLCGQKNISQKVDNHVSEGKSDFGFEAIDTSRREQGELSPQEKLHGTRDSDHNDQDSLPDVV